MMERALALAAVVSVLLGLGLVMSDDAPAEEATPGFDAPPSPEPAPPADPAPRSEPPPAAPEPAQPEPEPAPPAPEERRGGVLGGLLGGPGKKPKS